MYCCCSPVSGGMQNQADANPSVRQISERLRLRKRKRFNESEVSLWCLQTALCITSISNYNFDLGVAWLTSKKRRGAPVPSDATNDSLKELLEDAFLQQADGHLNSWVDPATSTLPATVIKTALAYAQGDGLAAWVRDSNVSTGTVVRTERLIEQHNGMISRGSASSEVLNVVRPYPQPTARKWAQRWRGKHGGFVGSLNVRDPIPEDEIRQKVRFMCVWRGKRGILWCVKWSYLLSHGPDWFDPGVRFFSDWESGFRGRKRCPKR